MNCEICGVEITGKPYKTKIENSVMVTCFECSKFGKVQHTPQPKKNTSGKIKVVKKQQSQSNKRQYTRPPKPEYEVVEDYNIKIRQARENNKLKREKLAEKINEKESVVARIETGKMMPDIKLARKIEKLLNIKLVEEVEDSIEEQTSAVKFRNATIGDVVRIKKSK